MGNKQCQLSPHQINDISKETNFDDCDIFEYYCEFKKDHPDEKITMDRFKTMYKEVYPNGNPDTLAEQMFRVYDTDKNGYIDFREFISGVGLLSRGTAEQKLKVVFRIYDIDNDGFITRDELETMMMIMHKAAGSVSMDVEDSGALKDHVKTVFEKLDANNDEKISFDEFTKAAASDPMLKQLLKSTP